MLGRGFRVGQGLSRCFVARPLSSAAIGSEEQIPVKSKLAAELIGRGYLYQCTDLNAFDKRIQNFESGSDSALPITMYVGFDATASSLHAGSLIQLMLARIFLKHGHNVICLIGGGTTKIGDPSGKDVARQMLSEEVWNDTA